MAEEHYKRREHYVPKFYLKGFSDDNGKVWVYDRETKKCFSQIPDNICSDIDLYETKAEGMHPAMGNYVLRNKIEDDFSDSEREWSQLLKKIQRVCCANLGRDALICNSNEKRTLAEFVANIILRNPWSMDRAELDEIADAKELHEVQEYTILLERLGMGKIDSLLRFINRSNYFNDEFGDQKLLADELFEKKISFIFNDNNDLVTSSYPVFCGVRNGYEEQFDVIFPLFPNLLLLYGFEDAENVRRNRLGRNKNISLGLKYLYLKAYSSSKARFIVGRKKEDLFGVETPEQILHAFKANAQL